MMTKDMKLSKTPQLFSNHSTLFLDPTISAYYMSFLEMISSSPQFLLFSLCACFLILHSFEFPPYSFTEAARGNETDQQALLAFKDGITSDPFGELDSWNHSLHFCHWSGVTCGRLHSQRVTKLNLGHRKLAGSITPHIGNLSFLRVLMLRNNSFSLEIPPEIGRLRRLQIVSLWNNSISGQIPVNISRCSNLVVLELSGNNLEGEIPREVGMLSKLEGLYIGWNLKITGGIPASLANLSSLRTFFATKNAIGGSVPYQLGRLSKLENFGVSENKLVGTIPPSIWNISSIRAFSVAYNQIGGGLPSEFGGIIFPRLFRFENFNNLFTGTIPVSISNASYVEVIQMHSNKLSGDVPPMEKLVHLRTLTLGNNLLGSSAGEVCELNFLCSLTNASNLETLDLFNNRFGGELPTCIGNLSTNSLKNLFLASIEVSGIIPHEVGNLASLERLDLRNNKLTCNIPSTIGNLHKLQGLSLSNNDLSGIIPPSFGNLSILLYLYADRNNLHGTIPSSLGKCSKLLELFISSNNLQGNIPKEIFFASSLYSLDLAGNLLIGNLPEEVGILVHLVELDISGNMLSGKIPNTLASCVQLARLNMGFNNFSGTLPSSLRSLRGLEIFNISRNNFSGTIPKYLEVFPFLQSLDLSFNEFEGAIPEGGVFKNATTFNVKGNNKLCGGISELHLPRCNSNLPEKKVNVKLIIGLSFGVTGAVIFLLFLYLCWSKKPRKPPSLRSPWNALLKLSYQNLYEATGGFSDANLIGVGSFGSVYKGILPQGQRTVAVKVLNLQHQGASRSFQAECEALRRIRHRNLLKVVTACSSVDHQGNDFKALVYEFMPNGSLDDWLHLHEIQDEIQTDARNLDLGQRLDIAIDVASAVEYLHHRCEEKIIHCDLKPSNILLDEDMVAHVGDFGLAKLIHAGTINQSSDNHSSTNALRGSVGYVAPEYGVGNEVSTFGDVYSFGIIVLELCTGKRPTSHDLFNDNLNLRGYVEKAFPNDIEAVADSRILVDNNGDTSRNNADPNRSSENKIRECLISLFKVGIACAQELPRDRMEINDAIVQLNAIKKALLRTGSIHAGRSITLEMPSQGP